jgi:hypothetical protein
MNHQIINTLHKKTPPSNGMGADPSLYIYLQHLISPFYELKRMGFLFPPSLFSSSCLYFLTKKPQKGVSEEKSPFEALGIVSFVIDLTFLSSIR